VLRTAIEAIDPVEWKLLRKNLSVSETVRQAENDQLLIDPHDLPEELLQKRAD
jgi:hypothetical protein